MIRPAPSRTYRPAVHASARPNVHWGYDLWFALTTASVFVSDIVGPGKAALFSTMALLTALLHAPVFLRSAGWRATFSLSLLAFLAVHIAFALRINLDTFQLKLGQAAIALCFTMPLVWRYSQLPIRRYFLFFLICMAALIAWCIVYHVGIGRTLGWKSLYDTKHLFSLLPFVSVVVLTSPNEKIRRLGGLVLLLSLVLIMMSGQRKAILLLAAAWLLTLSIKRPILMIAPIIVALLLPAAAQLDSSGYLTRQLSSIDLFSDKEDSEVTYSDNERAFQRQYAQTLFEQSPLFGYGTNGYSRQLQSDFSPTNSLENPYGINTHLNFHGELGRILVEYGLIGSIPVAVLLLMAFLNAWKGGGAGTPSGRSRLLAFMMVATFVAHWATEAFDTIMVIGYCLAPCMGRLKLDEASTASSRAQRSDGLPRSGAGRRRLPRGNVRWV